MTIRKGEPWGEKGGLPDDGVMVHSDAEAREVVCAARHDGKPIPFIGLLGGDLCRTLGGRGNPNRLRSGEGTVVTIDLGTVLIDGRLNWFVAHLIARHRLWRQRTVAVMNAEWLGEWDVAPRAHPNDGRLDVFDASLDLGERLQARRRMPQGTHVPHPGIRQQTVTATHFDLERTTPIHLDGVLIGKARKLAVRVEADALTVVV